MIPDKVKELVMQLGKSREEEGESSHWDCSPRRRDLASGIQPACSVLKI